jgi:carbon monoxide dehydrogenase subunit G
MTEVFAVEAVVDRPVAEVWARLVDLERAPAWMAGVDGLRAQGPVAAGTTVVFTARGKERSGTITAVEPGRSLTLRSAQGGVTADYTYTVAPAGAGTRVGLVAATRMTGPVRLLGPVVRAAIRRADRGQVAAFAKECATPVA